MSRGFDIGDRIICTESGVVGICTKIYIPTACGEQAMVRTDDGRMHHAPSLTWKKVEDVSILIPSRNCGRTAVYEALLKERMMKNENN